MKFREFDKVEKSTGYLFPGVVVAVVSKLNGETRYVVECIAKEARGMLHIFNEDQLNTRYEP
jgi:hypothetical protein